MSKRNTEIVIGMDISDKKSEICILDVDGKVQKKMLLRVNILFN